MICVSGRNRTLLWWSAPWSRTELSAPRVELSGPTSITFARRSIIVGHNSQSLATHMPRCPRILVAKSVSSLEASIRAAIWPVPEWSSPTMKLMPWICVTTQVPLIGLPSCCHDLQRKSYSNSYMKEMPHGYYKSMKHLQRMQLVAWRFLKFLGILAKFTDGLPLKSALFMNFVIGIVYAYWLQLNVLLTILLSVYAFLS